MTAPALHPFEAILRHVAAARPGPWYPTAYAQATGTPRDTLDPYLDDLRMAGFIRLTDWEPGHGQGYALTSEGDELLASPRQMARLAQGRLARPAAPRRRPEGEDFLPVSWERGKNVREALLFATPPRVTMLLIALNLFVFAAGVVFAARHQVSKEYLDGSSSLKVWEINRTLGALTGEDVYRRGQWWRLLTACFVHIGWVHLGSNMLSLFLVGPLLERVWGGWRFLTLYLVAGLGGSCGMLLENPIGGGAGASGAIWGILASLIGWLLLHRSVLPPELQSRAWAQLLITFVIMTWMTFEYAHVSKGGHFGGGVVGLLASFPLDATRYARGAGRWLAWAALAAVPVVSVAVLEVGFHRGIHLGSLVRLAPIGELIDRYVERREIREFLDGLLPQVSSSVQTARKVYDGQVAPLLVQAPPQRDPAAVGQALDDIAKVRSELGKVIGAVASVGPFTDADLERVRAVGMKYAELWDLVLGLAGEGLQQGPAWPFGDRLALRWSESVTERLRNKWRGLVGDKNAQEVSGRDKDGEP